MNIQNSFLFSTDSDKTRLNNLLTQATVNTKYSLKQFANQLDFESNLRLAFGNDIDTKLLKESWIVGEFALTA